MRLLAARTVPFVACVRLPQAIRPALLAGLIAAGTLLAIGVSVLSSPDAGEGSGAQTVRQADPGGETVVAKFAVAGTSAQTESETAAQTTAGEPPPVSRLLAMALAPAPLAAPPRREEPSLAGLSEIPRDLIWNRPQDKEKKAEPKAFAAFSKAREQLPWDAVEPVPFSPLPSSAPAPSAAAGAKPASVSPQPLDLPDGGQVEAWVKAKVTEIKGAARSRPLYHFELWLEPPVAVKRRLVGVAYNFSTPAVRPQSQASSDKTSGFRISAGGLACADAITVTLRFDDGRSQQVTVDGCKLLS